MQRVRVNVDVAPCRAFAGKLPRRALTNARVADLVKQTGCLRRSTAARVEERVGALTIAAHVWRWTSRATIPNGLATDAGPFAALFVPTAGDPATPAVCGVGQHFETDLAATRAGRAADSRTADLRRLTERARIDLTLHIGGRLTKTVDAHQSGRRALGVVGTPRVVVRRGVESARRYEDPHAQPQWQR